MISDTGASCHGPVSSVSSLEKRLFSSSARVLIGLLAFASELYEFLNILESSHLSDIWFANTSSHLVNILFIC